MRIPSNSTCIIHWQVDPATGSPRNAFQRAQRSGGSDGQVRLLQQLVGLCNGLSQPGYWENHGKKCGGFSKIHDTTGNSTDGPRVDGLKSMLSCHAFRSGGIEMHRRLKCMFTNDLAPESLRHNTSFLQSPQDLLPDYALLAGISTQSGSAPLVKPHLQPQPNSPRFISASPVLKPMRRRPSKSARIGAVSWSAAWKCCSVEGEVTFRTLKILDTYHLSLILLQTLLVCYPPLNRPCQRALTILSSPDGRFSSSCWGEANVWKVSVHPASNQKKLPNLFQSSNG